MLIKEYKRETMTALGSVALLYLFTVLVLPMGYLTSDDHGIQNALSGFSLGMPYPYHQFINCILGYPLAFLYRVMPQVQWWYVFSMFCMMTGIYLIHRNWLILCRVKQVNKVITYFAIGFFSFFVWAYYLSQSAFTIVPSIFSLGFLTTLLIRKRDKIVISDLVIPCLACLLGSFIRYQTGQVVFCYLSLCILYYCIRIEKTCSRNLIIVMFVYLAVYGTAFLGCHQYDRYVSNQMESQEFQEFNKARIRYTDYPHLQYANNSEFYESIGWDSELAILADHWCFLDERITTESFKAIAQKTEKARKDAQNRSLPFKVWMDQVTGSRFSLGLTTIMYFTIIIGFVYFARIGEPEAIFLLFNIFGTISLIVYLCILGRLPTRAYSVLGIPMIVISWFLMIGYWEELGDRSRGIRQLLTLFALLYAGVSCGEFVYSSDRIAQIERAKDCAATINEYLLENKENIYIYSLTSYMPGDSEQIYAGDKPNNAFFFGGISLHSHINNMKAENMGLEAISMRTFQESNVYYMTYFQKEPEVSQGIMGAFFSTLTDYGATKVMQVDNIEEYASIFQFEFDENLEGYTGFYEQGEFRFYYKDGIRQKGFFEVEGEKYYGRENGEFIAWEGGYLFTEGALENVENK